MLSVEGELGLKVIDVFGDQASVTSQALAPCDPPRQAVQPAHMRLRLLQDYGVALLKDLVDGDEGFERLDFVGKNWLPEA